jgi:hypothetical protein
MHPQKRRKAPNPTCIAPKEPQGVRPGAEPDVRREKQFASEIQSPVMSPLNPIG